MNDTHLKKERELEKHSITYAILVAFIRPIPWLLTKLNFERFFPKRKYCFKTIKER